MRLNKIVLLLIIFGFPFAELVNASGNIPAFPGAEGYGAYSQGGRYGKVIFVTNLQDYDPEKEAPIPGSFRAACDTEGPRIVIFKVSGIIPLKTYLSIKEPYITIAGQSAPGMGICIKNYGLKITTNNVIVRYMRVRPADNMEVMEGFQGDNVDGISVTNGKQVIIDHCSASWSVDETLSVTHSDSVTVQWCMITESLNCSAHQKGCHGYGSLVRGEKGAGVTYHHNLYAHHDNRNPRPGGHIDPKIDTKGWTFDFRNNVIYNWGQKSAGYNMDGINSPDFITRMNFIGNYYLAGANTKSMMIYRERCLGSTAYFDDNWMNGECPASPWELIIFDKRFTPDLLKSYKKSEPFKTPNVKTDDAETALRKVLSCSGAILPLRDPIDNRIVTQVISKLNGNGDIGHIIDDEDEVGGWPEYLSTPPPKDDDNDGMPNAWEVKNGLDPNETKDASLDMDKDGYTNIEEFLNCTDPQVINK